MYQEKFHKLKDKIYKRCKRLNDEVGTTKKAFQHKMSEFFSNYIQMLKEIIFTNSKVSFP